MHSISSSLAIGRRSPSPPFTGSMNVYGEQQGLITMSASPSGNAVYGSGPSTNNGNHGPTNESFTQIVYQQNEKSMPLRIINVLDIPPVYTGPSWPPSLPWEVDAFAWTLVFWMIRQRTQARLDPTLIIPPCPRWCAHTLFSISNTPSLPLQTRILNMIYSLFCHWYPDNTMIESATDFEEFAWFRPNIM